MAGWLEIFRRRRDALAIHPAAGSIIGVQSAVVEKAWPSFIWNASAIGALAAFPFFALVFHPDSAWREGCTFADFDMAKAVAGACA